MASSMRGQDPGNQLVTIVIPNWNGRSFLAPCLRALERQTFTDYVVIVVDNGSTDGSVEWVKRNYPRVQVIANEENRGFAAGLCVGTGAPPGPFGWIFVSSIKAGPIEWLNLGRLDDRLIKEAAEWRT